jgi:hypothetical protein
MCLVREAARRPTGGAPGLIEALGAGVRIGEASRLVADDAAVLSDDAQRTDLRGGAAGGSQAGGGGQEQGE